MADLSDWGDFLSGVTADVIGAYKAIGGGGAVVSGVKTTTPTTPLLQPTTKQRALEYIAIGGGALVFGFGIFWLAKKL